MPWLNEITYSREACVAAVRDFYSFLTKMYLKETDFIEPPEGGWPSISPDRLRYLGKTNEVIALVRQLPYIRAPSDDRDKAQGIPNCYFADWQNLSGRLSENSDRTICESLKVLSEGADYPDAIPPHVFGLTYGGRNNPKFLLDTNLGIVHWLDCFGEIRNSPSREFVEDDPYDYAAENEQEAEWRGDAPAWAIADFFKLLKDQFLELRFIPISSRSVLNVYFDHGPRNYDMIPMLQRIYREHGWPDLQRFRKHDCLDAVRTALRERYPDEYDCHDDE